MGDRVFRFGYKFYTEEAFREALVTRREGKVRAIAERKVRKKKRFEIKKEEERKAEELRVESARRKAEEEWVARGFDMMLDRIRERFPSLRGVHHESV